MTRSGVGCGDRQVEPAAPSVGAVLVHLDRPLRNLDRNAQHRPADCYQIDAKYSLESNDRVRLIDAEGNLVASWPKDAVRSIHWPPGAPGAEDPTDKLEDDDLFERLSEWRLEVARARKDSAFKVATDQTLREIASVRPRTLAALLEVRGMGPGKVERYGEQLLELIEQHQDGPTRLADPSADTSASDDEPQDLVRPHDDSSSNVWELDDLVELDIDDGMWVGDDSEPDPDDARRAAYGMDLTSSEHDLELVRGIVGARTSIRCSLCGQIVLIKEDHQCEG